MSIQPLLYRPRRLGNSAGSLWAVALAACLLAGCSSGPGGPFSLTGPTHKLLDTAKAMKQTAPVPAAVPRELDKRPQPPYVVEPGDVLLVLPADVDSPIRLPGDQPVMPDGTIQLGKYARLQVAGKTVEEIEAAVKLKIDAKDAGVFTVRVVTRQSKVYYVLGEVNAPGAYQLSGRETVLDAVLAAGGLTGSASRDNIILDRPTAPDSCRTVLPVCWSEIVQLGDTSTNYQITAGDRIYVPSRTFWEDFCRKPQCPCGARPQTACQIPAADGGAGIVVEGAPPTPALTGPWGPPEAAPTAAKP
jgi:polysaccharide export outer membrane protein